MPRSKFDEPTVIQKLIDKARSTMPSVIANEITSVQPINMINPFSKKWDKIGIDMPTDKWVYNVRSQEINTWIEEQPVHMWKFYDFDEYNLNIPVAAFIGQNYLFTEEMEAWFQLRWG